MKSCLGKFFLILVTGGILPWGPGYFRPFAGDQEISAGR